MSVAKKPPNSIVKYIQHARHLPSVQLPPLPASVRLHLEIFLGIGVLFFKKGVCGCVLKKLGLIK